MAIFQLQPISTAASWSEVLARCRDEHEVVLLVRDFVAQFAPEDIARLAPACRPGKFMDGGDITNFAFVLATHHGADQDPGAFGIHARFTHFFSDAARRLSALTASRGRAGGNGAA